MMVITILLTAIIDVGQWDLATHQVDTLVNIVIHYMLDILHSFHRNICICRGTFVSKAWIWTIDISAHHMYVQLPLTQELDLLHMQCNRTYTALSYEKY